MKTKLLVVEDDAALGFIIKDNLELKGWEVDLHADGESAWKAFREQSYAVCLLDIMLPKKDGFALIENIRKVNRQVPVLFLTARAGQKDKLEAFKRGADDYITKPFSMEELFFRIGVFLRRSEVPVSVSDKIQLGSYLFDVSNLLLQGKGEAIRLTQKEVDLLKLFAANREQLLKREDILKAVWGDDDYFLGRSLDVFVSKLRKYLKEDERLEILNQFGVGFRFTEKAR
jgi:DNA-binding response OmpR family regulator